MMRRTTTSLMVSVTALSLPIFGQDARPNGQDQEPIDLEAYLAMPNEGTDVFDRATLLYENGQEINATPYRFRRSPDTNRMILVAIATEISISPALPELGSETMFLQVEIPFEDIRISPDGNSIYLPIAEHSLDELTPYPELAYDSDPCKILPDLPVCEIA